MEIGVSIFRGVDIDKQVECFKKLGVTRTFLASYAEDFDYAMQAFNKNGIICETLHAPFEKINDMWGDDEEAAKNILDRLKDSVDKCVKYNVPISVDHVSSGRPMPEITEKGVKRYEELFRYAKERGVKIALENLRYLENLQYFMDRYEDVGFCWDNGHEYCRAKGIRYMDHFGKRLIALHIHDNRCEMDTDDHLLPFDGNIDFETVAKDIADSGYEGSLMLEIGKLVSVDGKRVYENLSDEEYIKRAVDSARKVADMVEKYKANK